ncbi:glycosyltransferase [Nonomuraea africana]|uniref:glycosyltransferase n=1 Tax=Nonomuraea africana TaxID=46171 RepID=UPI0033CC87E0
MRVAFVLGTTSGGTGRHVVMLAEGLLRGGHQVLVVGPDSVEEQFGFRALGAAFAPVPVSDRPHPVNDVRAVARIRRCLREADVVHAHGLRAGALTALAGAFPSRTGPQTGAPMARAGARAGGHARRGALGGALTALASALRVLASVFTRRKGVLTSRRGAWAVPLVVTLHNALTAGGLVGAVYGVLERVVARGADRVLVVSPDLGDRMRALGARDVRAAVVPAPPPRAATRSVREVLEELGAAERPVVLTVARLAQQKGLDTLLDVAAEGSQVPGERDRPGGAAGGGPGEAEGGEELLFVVAGDGPLREVLQDRIDAERLPVLLLGNRDDVPDLLAAATLVVWPSRWEGQPLSLSEALMAGKPVVATAVGGIPELMGGAGVLVPYGDVEAMRAAVRKVVGDPGERRRLAEAAARRGAELPDAEDAVEAALAAYRTSSAGEDD